MDAMKELCFWLRLEKSWSRKR